VTYPGLAPRRLGSASPAPGYTIRPFQGQEPETAARTLTCDRGEVQHGQQVGRPGTVVEAQARHGDGEPRQGEG